MYSEEELTVASLAQLVGSELNTIDRNTESRTKAPANKLDPRSFLNKNHVVRQSNSNVVKHDGMHFHAGVDESLVQSMYPDLSVTARAQPVAAPVQPAAIVQPIITSPPAAVYPGGQAVAPAAAAVSPELIKVLQSIDKTLKSIDKTEKNLATLVAHLTSTNSDKNTGK